MTLNSPRDSQVKAQWTRLPMTAKKESKFMIRWPTALITT